MSTDEVGESSCAVPPVVVKEGWLSKRGEFIKNWRLRYFFLLEDGKLLGFKTKPKQGLEDPLNNFTVRRCQILKTEKPRSNTFVIRGLHWRAVIERSFNAETASNRDEWIEAIMQVSEKLGEPSPSCSVKIREFEDLEESPPKYSDQDDSPCQEIQERLKKVTLDNFEFIRVLGRGTFGKVMLCRQKKNDRIYAMKVLRKDVIIERRELAHTYAENCVLKAVDHPFLTCLKYSFQTNDYLCFVMEYVNGGELFFHLTEERSFTEERTRFYGAEICLALGYLHERNIIYRDLKLENILLDAEGHIKITDFGLCKENICYGRTTHTFCGTPEYLAPEILLGNDYGRGVDWWGYGICLYEMVIGQLPFYEKDYDKLFQLIVTEDIKFPRTISQDASDLLERLLHKNPGMRLGSGPGDVREIQSHHFYEAINWKNVEEKKVTPPFKPQVAGETDTSNFNRDFTGELVHLTPPDHKYYPGVTVEDSESLTFNKFSYQDLSSNLGSSTTSSLHSLGFAEKG